MNSVETDPCEVCMTGTAESRSSDMDGVHQVCPRCGEFRLTGRAASKLRRGTGVSERALLSGWIREKNIAGSVPTITPNTIDAIFQRALPPVGERAFSLLKEAERGLDKLGEQFDLAEPRFIAASYSEDFREVTYLMKLLSELGFAEFTGMGGKAEISPTGYLKLDELRGRTSESTQGFVAMWFHENLKGAYEDGFEVGVFNAGYDPIRIDRVEHINRIDDEIIRQINASRFLVADFTGHRGGVYFEAGYALGRELPVFWTCKSSDMDDLHFDIRQFNCIAWDSPSDLAERLATRLEAVLGVGPKKGK